MHNAFIADIDESGLGQSVHVMQQPISVTVRPRKKKRFDSARVPNYSSLFPQQRTVKGMSFPKIFFSNVRSMVNKVDDIFASVSVNLCDIVVIVESWLTSSVTDDLISMLGYVMCESISVEEAFVLL